MKAIRIMEPGKLEICDLPTPSAGPGQVRIKVKAAGICGSDIHIYHGRSLNIPYPVIPGHEFAGEIDQLGEGVTGLKLGDPVAVDPTIGCGNCYACDIGHPNICIHSICIGAHVDGGFAEHAVIPAQNAHPVPAGWSWERGALVEPFTIAANMLGNIGVRKEDRVFVLGAGTIGLAVVQGVVRLGARCAVGDINDARLERSMQCGAELAINTAECPIEDKLLQWTERVGPSVIIDAVGVPSLFETFQKIAAPAGKIGLLGYPTETPPFSYRHFYRKELSLYGSRLSKNRFPEVIGWFKREEVKPELLLTHVLPYTEVLEGMRLMQEDPTASCKIQIKF